MLAGVRLEEVSTVVYCRKYLRHLLEHQNYYLDIYADLLEKLLEHSPKQKQDITLVDYGAGNGLLGIFAKYCGFNRVCLVDIDAAFLTASKVLAGQLNVAIDGYLCGDIADLQTSINPAPDAVAGTDVIEHIYDLKTFFHGLKELNPQMVTAFSTAANPDNYFKSKRLKKLQLKDEFEGGEPEDFILFGEIAHEAFIRIREKIIRKNARGIDEKVIQTLSSATRGMKEADIILAIEQYRSSKELPSPPTHPTNTCNPVSGSWTERILSRKEYQAIYSDCGFQLVIYNGFYDTYKKNIKAVINVLLNIAIKGIGKEISPYIILIGYKK